MISSKFEAVLIVIALIGAVSAITCPTGTNVIPQCSACVGSGSSISCSSCLNGYYLVGGSCVACSAALPNCAQCTLGTGSVPQCYICQSGYGLLNATCANCSSISGCSSCLIWNYQLQCSTCSAGLVLYTAQMQCVPCQISNCNNCSISTSGNFSCSSCATGYFNANNTCNSCAQSITYCASCQKDTNGKLICSSCAATRLYLYNNTCLANCTANGYPRCATCQLLSLTTNAIACLTCTANYYLNPTSESCEPCSQALTGCANCSASSTGSGNATQTTVSCSACSDGYFLSSNPATCVLCSSVRPNCQSCSFSFGEQAGQCTVCASGYYLNSTDLACYSCTAPPTGTPTFPSGSCSACAMSGSSMICTTCSSTYYLVNTTCVSCSSYMSNCSTCTFNGKFTCTGCKSGWLISSAGQCPLCSSIYPHCQFCSSSQCTDCIAGYYTIDNKQCVQNCLVSNCKLCATKDNSRCVTCGAGYILSGSTCVMQTCTAPLSFNGVACICPFQSYYQQSGNTCQPCSDPFCEICDSSQCSSCLDGYFLQGSSCVKCISNCQTCTANNNCLLCVQGFYFNQNSCVAYSQSVLGGIGIVQNSNLYQLCGLGCSLCSSSVCLSCAPGYFLNGSSCSFCPSNCKICITTSTIVTTTINSTNTTNTTTVNTTVINLVCLECNSGMALINESCGACTDSNCVRCDYNVYFCLLCSMTYTADSTGTCKACAANCNFCESGGPGTCDEGSCFLGYVLANSTSCVRCYQGCASCSLTNLTCIGCLVGSYSLPNSSCANCPAGCLTCNDYSTCTSCDPNFNLLNGACLQACELPCVACYLNNGTQICTSCLQGYSLIGGNCTADFSCEGSSICQFCPLGFFAYQGQCHQCASNCIACTFTPADPAFVIAGTNYLSYLSCSMCNIGFYLDNTLNCQPCRSSCRHCLAINLCNQCVPGYFLEYKLLNGISSLNYSIGVCKKCGSGCSECEAEPNRCLSCKSSFFLNNFVCTSLNNVSFVFTLASASNSSSKTMLTAVLNNLPQLYSDIANSLGSTYVQNNYLLILSSIANGSVIVSGSASIDPSVTDPSTAYNSVSNNVKQTSKISGYTVFAYSLSPNGFTPSTTTTTSSTSYLIYIIIGGSILAVGIIILIVCLCLRYRKKKSEQNPAMQTEKVETEQNEPATSKNMLKSEEVYPKSSVREDRRKKSKTQKTIQVSHISGNKTLGPQNEKPSVSPSKPSKHEKSRKENREKQIQLSRNDKDYDRQISIHSKQAKSREERKKEVSRLPEVASRIQQELKESEEISKNIMKSKSKSKSSKNIPESIGPQETFHFKSARYIQEESSRRPREIEKLRNDTNIEQPQPPKQSRKSQKGNSNSISHKYVPNSNSHYI